MISPYRASAARRSPTFHAVTRADNFLGEGSVPALTRRHTVAGELAKSAWTTGSRTNADAGSESKYSRDSGSSERVTDVVLERIVTVKPLRGSTAHGVVMAAKR